MITCWLDTHCLVYSRNKWQWKTLWIAGSWKQWQCRTWDVGRRPGRNLLCTWKVLVMGNNWQILKGQSSIVSRQDHWVVVTVLIRGEGISRVEVGDGLSLVVASWLGTAAALKLILIKGMSTVEAGNGSDFVCSFGWIWQLQLVGLVDL